MHLLVCPELGNFHFDIRHQKAETLLGGGDGVWGLGKSCWKSVGLRKLLGM